MENKYIVPVAIPAVTPAPFHPPLYCLIFPVPICMRGEDGSETAPLLQNDECLALVAVALFRRPFAAAPSISLYSSVVRVMSAYLIMSPLLCYVALTDVDDFRGIPFAPFSLSSSPFQSQGCAELFLTAIT